ncbi:GNAT family N-acetyltransferase [Pseudorhizobium tarimense]|uniref:GNAT family N-acetyltransferase n=1 Tax=Pseudorhizobium tarimense TaxID=1079109 RepID=UPI003391F5EF|nr:GNAT family N-acetyltransferase [Pseudorhizobium tarimense]
MSSIEPRSRFNLVARRHEKLETIEGLWRAMSAEGTTTAFQQIEWVKAVCKCLLEPACETPFFVEISDAHSAKTLMLMPFVLIRKRNYSAIEYLGMNVCDISAPVLGSLDVSPQSFGQTLWDALASVLPKADFVHIDHIPTFIQERPNPLASLPGIRAGAKRSYDVAIDGDPETIVNRLVNNQTRRILKTSARRMAERGQVSFVAASTEADIDTLFPVMVSQRLDRFRELGRFDFLEKPEVQAFYRNAAMASLGGRGPAQLFGLSVNGEWIATTYTLVHANTIHLAIVTMADASWHPCSPGMANIAHYVRWAREQGITMVDFSIGDLAYKTGFGGQPRDRYTFWKPLTIKGRFIVNIRHGSARLKQAIKDHPALSHFTRRAIQLYRGRNQSHGQPLT